MNTMTRINQLSKERQNLWRLAGQQPLSDEQVKRVQAITNELYSLWDVHRREVASVGRIQRPTNLINLPDLQKVA